MRGSSLLSRLLPLPLSSPSSPSLLPGTEGEKWRGGEDRRTYSILLKVVLAVGKGEVLLLTYRRTIKNKINKIKL
jgi:hypothetical protein